MHLLLSHPFLQIYLHKGPRPVLELQWLSYVGSVDFRAAALQALDFTRTHHVKGWLADDRLLGAVRPRDLEWAEQTVFGPLAQAGVERFARLEPQDALNRLTISGLYTRVIGTVSFELRYFDDLAAARAWASGGAT